MSLALGKVLRRWRRCAGLSQRQLARRVGVDRAIVARREAGTHLVRLETITQTAAAIGADVREALAVADTFAIVANARKAP